MGSVSPVYSLHKGEGDDPKHADFREHAWIHVHHSELAGASDCNAMVVEQVGANEADEVEFVVVADEAAIETDEAGYQFVAPIACIHDEENEGFAEAAVLTHEAAMDAALVFRQSAQPVEHEESDFDDAWGQQAIVLDVFRPKLLSIIRNIFFGAVRNSRCPAELQVHMFQQQQLRAECSEFFAAIKSLLDHGVDATDLQDMLNDDPEWTPENKQWYQNLVQAAILQSGHTPVLLSRAKLPMQVVGQRPDARPDAGPAADPRAKSPEESTPESIARVKLFAETDKAIIWAMDCGFPVWNTPGHGGAEPNRPSHNCWDNSLKESARINFYNDGVEDDFQNETLAQWFKSLPNYRIKVMRNFGEITKCSQGNAIEMILGISYTAFRNGRNLPATQSLVFPDDDSRDAWIKVWEGMKQLGLQYKFSDTARTTSAGQPSQSSQSCNAGSCRRMGAVAPY